FDAISANLRSFFGPASSTSGAGDGAGGHGAESGAKQSRSSNDNTRTTTTTTPKIIKNCKKPIKFAFFLKKQKILTTAPQNTTTNTTTTTTASTTTTSTHSNDNNNDNDNSKNNSNNNSTNNTNSSNKNNNSTNNSSNNNSSNNNNNNIITSPTPGDASAAGEASTLILERRVVPEGSPEQAAQNEAWYEDMDVLLTKFVELRTELDEVLGFASKRMSVMVAKYPGQGAHYARHRDALPEHESPRRRLTGVYYLNSSWLPEYGGCFR
ncbi:unnamed protein product, partial [Polarella glacialis]